MSRAVAPDAIGYPGPPGKPTPVAPETANLWRSLGIHIPPQTLRESRENHEKALHKILTAIAIKLERLSRATQADGAMMARQDEVDAEFSKIRKEMALIDSKALSAARSAGLSAVTALTDRVEREGQKLKIVTSQQEIMRKELSEVKHILAEDEAAEAAFANTDVDFIEMSKDEKAVQDMYQAVADQADLAEKRMQDLLADQQMKNKELAEMRSDMKAAQAKSQELVQRQSLNASDREARLHEEIRRMQADMTSGGQQMAKLQQEQAAAMAEAEAAAKQRMLDLQAKLNAEQEKLKSAVAGQNTDDAQAMQQQIAALNEKMQAESEALNAARGRAADESERQQAALRKQMAEQQAALQQKMQSLESRSELDQAAAEAKSNALLDQLQQEQAEMAAQDAANKSAAQLEAEKKNAAEIERLRAMMQEQANQPPVQAGTPDEMQKIFEQLEAERAKLDAIQQSHAVAESEHEKMATSEMKRLEEQLQAAQKDRADGNVDADSRAENLASELEMQRQEAEKRMAHERKIREAEQAAVMAQMARLQSALDSERDQNLTLIQQQDSEAAAKSQAELAAKMAKMAEELASSKQQMAELEANQDTKSSQQADQARAAVSKLEAQLAAEQAKMTEIEESRQAQADMLHGIQNAHNLAQQQMSEMQVNVKSSSQTGETGAVMAAAEAEQRAAAIGAAGPRAALGSRGKTRVQRKLEQKVEIEELRGRVGALTIKMGRLTKLLSMMEGSDDIAGLLKQLRDEKADKIEVEELEKRLLAAGVGGGASMGNALKQMEESIADHAKQIANIIVTKADISDVSGAADKAHDRLMEELEKHAAQLAKLYAETTGRMDGLDEAKAERDWIEDLIAKIRRQVAGLKKKVNEGAVDGAMDGLSGMLSGQISMFVKGEHPKNWPPNIDQLPSPRTGAVKKRSGLGQQLVYRGGFPMASPSVSIPSRLSTDPTSGVTRQSFSSSYAKSGVRDSILSRSASSALLPRLSGEIGTALDESGSKQPGPNDSAVLTEDLVDRFRRSIWPPPSIPAFGSWPEASDVLDRARDIVTASSSMLGSSNGMQQLLSNTQRSQLSTPIGSPTRAMSPNRKPSMLSASKGRVKGTAAGTKLPPASGRHSVDSAQFTTSQSKLVGPSGRQSAGA